MRFEISHEGVPLGATDLVADGLAVGDFDPAPGYAKVRDIIRDASKALWAMGFFHRETAQPRVAAEDLARGAALELEMRDENGTIVHPDFVNIVERPEPTAKPVVFARFRQSHSGRVASLPPQARSDRSESRPDA